MEFRKLIDHVFQPHILYDGIEVEEVTVSFIEPSCGSRDLIIDLAVPETRAWRHYYNSGELNYLKDELHFGFKFVLSRESAINKVIDEFIYLQPFYKYGAEYTVCFSYTERSPLRYIFWLIAILRRDIDKTEFDKRIKDIKQYWLPPGG